MKKGVLIKHEQLSSVLLKAQSPTLYGNTPVAGHQYVIASIFDATHDVSHHSVNVGIFALVITADVELKIPES